MPKLYDVLDQAGNCTQFKKALARARLRDLVIRQGPMTFFIPTDEAFDKMPEPIRKRVLGNVPKLKEMIHYHIVPGNNLAANVQRVDRLPSFQGNPIRVHLQGGLKVERARVVLPDVRIDNGVCHLIDEVLLPEAG